MSDDFNRDDLPDWLRNDADDDADEMPRAQPPLPDDDADETPDWLSRLGPPSAKPDEADELAAADLPNWLFESDDEAPESDAPADDDDSPSWLAGLDDDVTPAEDPPMPDLSSLGDRPSDEFLSLADSLPATSDLEMTYQQWREQQEQARNGPDLERETPDLFDDMDDLSEPASSTGELPDWYLGLDEMDESEVPDWMANETPSAPPSPPAAEEPDAAPPWLQGLDSPASQEPPPQTGDFDDDFFAALGLPSADEEEPPQDEPVDLSWLDDDALTTASDRTRDDAREDSFFDAVTAQPPPELPPLEPLEDLPDEDDESAGDSAAVLAGSADDDDRSWLQDVMPAAAEPEAEQALDDFFADLGDDAPPADSGDAFEIDWGGGADAPPTPAAVADDDFSMQFDDDENDDPFFDFDQPQAARRVDVNDEPDWLDDLDGESLLDAEQPPEPEGPSLLDAERPTLPSTAELESFLAGLDDGGVGLPQTGQLIDQTDFDFDEPFAPDMGPKPKSPVTGGNLAAATPDFLRDLEVSVGEISAGAIVRQRKDRPLDALPDRLKDLHTRGEQQRPADAAATDEDVLKRVLPGVSETLAAAPLSAGLPSIPEALALTDAERERVHLLRTLVRRETGAPADAAEDGATPAAANGKRGKAAKKRKIRRPTGKRRRRGSLDRLVIAAALAAAVVAPFYLDDLKLGNLPPAAFSAGTPGELAYARVEALRPGTLVLVGVEYGPTSAAELDPMLDVLVRHLLLVGAHPVLVGGNPVGLAHAANVVDAIAADAAFMDRADLSSLRPNRDYTVVRTITGDLVGLRALAEDATAFMLTDIRGQATGLNVESLRDFGLIAVVTDRGEDVRNYAEQVAPLAAAPLLLATGYGAGPLALPYANTDGVSGLLVGYGDAYTYAAMIGEPVLTDAAAPSGPVDGGPAVVAPDAGPSPTRGGSGIGLPNAMATFVARFAPAAAVDLTEEATDAATATDVPPTETLAPTATATTVATQPPGATARPTETDAPTATPTHTPTATVTSSPTATHTPTATPTDTPTTTATVTPSRTPTRTPMPPSQASAPVEGRIASNQTVNVRSGPGTNFSIIGAVPSRTMVDVLGVNENRTWYLVQLPDSDDRGWISTRLVYIEDGIDRVPTVAFEGAAKLRPFLRPLAQATDEAAPDVTAEATVAPTATDTPTPVVVIVAPDEPTAPPDYRDERWYAATLGIIASSTIIALGAAVNLARGVARRRSR